MVLETVLFFLYVFCLFAVVCLYVFFYFFVCMLWSVVVLLVNCRFFCLSVFSLFSLDYVGLHACLEKVQNIQKVHVDFDKAFERPTTCWLCHEALPTDLKCMHGFTSLL